MHLNFLGAAKTVTGSCFLLEAENKRILIDCGMYQGLVEHLNLVPFPFKPEKIDALLITHAHLDHVGKVPKLVKEGFKGEIIATRATFDLAKIMLRDSAKIQEEEVKKNERAVALYTIEDVENTIEKFSTSVKYGEEISIGKIKAKFNDAGHILGSAFIEIEAEGKRITFSGDLGNKGKPIVRDPEKPNKADFLILESTYGDRNHKSIKESVEELREAIVNTIERGNVIIPSFALERTQDILYFLREFFEKDLLPECRVFVDSPLATSATEIFLAHPECFDSETLKVFMKKDPFDFPTLKFTRSVIESKQINHIKSGAVIIAGAGMCTGGRILHHLKHNLAREECSIVFVGFQAEGTLGRKIIEGAKAVEILGEKVKVRAKIYTINGFSAHADQSQLVEWAKLAKAKRIFLVHGEERQAKLLSMRLKNCYIPSMMESVEL